MQHNHNVTYVLKLIGALLLTALSLSVIAHGLMESPAARNQFCGVLTKPDQVVNGTGLYPICGEAFVDDFNGGYSFMSVLTHAEGRKVVTPLPENVCGFNAETFNNGPTPWDKPIDWPTNNMQSGPNEIVWNIEWGPHFDDTKEFVYWITKADFQFQPGVPLTWNDFEPTPFCDLQYDDANPNANPNVTPDKPGTRFSTMCNVPERQGRHVIYGEWGRNQFTFERFHGCIDAQFSGGGGIVDAVVSATPNSNSFTGAGSVALSASNSVGSGLSYQWTVSSAGSANYTLSNASAETTQLTFTDPTAANNVTVTLVVSNVDGVTDSAAYSFEHLPESTPATWKLIGPLTATAQTLSDGQRVTVRSVDGNGVDSYLPASPLVIDSANSAADQWPYALALLINANNGDIALGTLDVNGNVVAQLDATANNIYTRVGADVAGAFLNIESPSASNCEFIIGNEWNTGYTATIKINNNGTTAINDWMVSWTLQSSQVGNLWNADFTAGTPNTAGNLPWNATIQPGQSVEFGFNGSKTVADTQAEIPIVFGAVCN